MADTFTWLHLSDLHAGMFGQQWLWPNLKHLLYEDLARVHEATGAWDVVVFSGDLTQRGSKPEYDEVTSILTELWQRFGKLGFAPKLMVVPGNHDLVRPAKDDPAHLLLNRWWEEENVREGTWSDAGSIYRTAIDRWFKPYTDWCEGIAAAGIPLVGDASGLMPGDRAAKIEFGGGSVGLIGLNTAWLQLSDAEVRGKLCLDVRQLHALTSNDPAAWSNANSANLVITHHPLDWLHPTARAHWNAEISPPGRFQAHLYGHMHDPNASTIAHGGSEGRRSLQAASIFGLEKVGSLDVERIHGYTVCQMSESGGMRVWPRRTTILKSGAWKLVPDHQFDLDKSDSFAFSGTILSINDSEQKESSSELEDTYKSISDADAYPEILEEIRYFISPSPASANVRRVEQRICLNGLSEDRATWVVAGWGSGTDGFIGAIQEQLKLPIRDIFRIDFGDFTTKSALIESIKSSVGHSFSEFCEALASVGPGLLILDDAPTTKDIDTDGKIPVELDIEEVAAVILGYCPKLRIVIRARQTPHTSSYATCSLKPLDEADLRSYIAGHERGESKFLTPDAISTIHRHTDGVPARVDTALRELELLSLDQLSTTNHDLTRAEVGSEDVPKGLADAVSELACSAEPSRERSFQMLKALSAFPSGETLDRIKRFNGAHALYPSHARELISSSLIATSTAPGSAIDVGHAPKLLVVPRPVRDYVRSQTPRDELSEITKKAANIYFGDNWRNGEIRPTLGQRFKSPVANAAEIGNATSIVLRLLNDAVEYNDAPATSSAVGLAKAYLSLLRKGDHYRSAAIVAKEIITQLLEVDHDDIDYFRIELARSLRMLGDVSDTLALLQPLNLNSLPSSRKQSVLLTLALAHQTLGDEDAAVSAAKGVLKIDRHSHSALQARSILLEVQEEEADETPEELRKLEARARKEGANTLANTLALSRIRRPDLQPQEIEEALEEVIRSAREFGDFYNLSRALITRAERCEASESTLTDRDMGGLIDAYHFLLSERLSSLFNRCHAALWREFTVKNETANLFRLFSQSSLIWRLRGDERSERKYAQKLAAHAQALISREFIRLEREIAYYIVRQSTLNIN